MADIMAVSRIINFFMKFFQCLGGVIAMLYQDGSYVWILNGWVLVSAALAFAYLYDQPNLWLEFTLLVLFCIPMKDALWNFSTINKGPAYIAILMLIDIIFLVMYKDKV